MDSWSFRRQSETVRKHDSENAQNRCQHPERLSSKFNELNTWKKIPALSRVFSEADVALITHK